MTIYKALTSCKAGPDKFITEGDIVDANSPEWSDRKDKLKELLAEGHLATEPVTKTPEPVEVELEPATGTAKKGTGGK
jgi:hypothetical protein